MKRIPIIDTDNISDVPSTRAVKIDFTNLDGTKSEAKFTFPTFTRWGDPLELANMYLSEMINNWTKYWLKITSYQVSLGSITDDGIEKYEIFYEPIKIPLNKVFVPAKRMFGSWQNPSTVLKREKEQNLNRMKNNMANGRHPLDGRPIRKRKPKQSPDFLN